MTNEQEYYAVGSEFKDKNSKGKDRKWKERKQENQKLANAFEQLNFKDEYVKKIFECAEVLKFVKETNDNNITRLKLYQMYSCQNKQCSVCAWRKSIKYQYQNSKVVEKAIEQNKNGRFLFMTLTVKNCLGKDLKDNMTHLTKSFDRLFRRAKVKKNMLGFIRSTEVTYNQTTKTYHPHIHVLCFVKTSYFKNKESYISQKELSEMWQKSAKLDYLPIAHITVVRDKNGEKDTKNAILETSKYPVKPLKNYDNIEVIRDLHHGLFKRRQVSYGGLFKTIRKELFSDLNESDLINIKEDEEEKDDNLELDEQCIIARWMANKQNYYVIKNDYL